MVAHHAQRARNNLRRALDLGVAYVFGLEEVGGEVRVTFELNGTLHVVKRASSNNEILLKIGDGDFQNVNEEDVRRLLPIQAYSQKQLSDVGVRTEELKRFIEQPISRTLTELRSKINDTGKKLGSYYNELVRKKEIQLEIDNYNLESESLNNRVKNLRDSLSGISDEDQKIINKKPKYDSEQIIIDNIGAELSVLEKKADELKELLELYPEPVEDIDSLENQSLIQEITTEVEQKFLSINKSIDGFKAVFNEESLKTLKSLIGNWEKKKEEYLVSYESAKERAKSSQQQLDEIHRIEQQLAEINRVLNQRKSTLKEIGNPEQNFITQRQEWLSLHSQKLDLLNGEAIKFSELSKGQILAEVTKSLNFEPVRLELKYIFEGTRIREERIQEIENKLLESEDPIQTLDTILEELRSLAEMKMSEDKTKSIPDTPILTELGYSENHKSKLCHKLTTDNWIKLATIQLDFNPEFKYATNKVLGDEIPFQDASAGQQATALLTVLLNQPGTPLIIDQPEDDIDNRAIEEIIKNIWEAKRRRQLIFTSHNANLVVNGDAELVICCDYRESTNQTTGYVKAQGA
ncbi:MAG: hypothetical protein IH946_00285, partial [Bacteroidetes bacterium]|nr:hypothetical protein [Bacteroidota bacterium]